MRICHIPAPGKFNVVGPQKHLTMSGLVAACLRCGPRARRRIVRTALGRAVCVARTRGRTLDRYPPMAGRREVRGVVFGRQRQSVGLRLRTAAGRGNDSRRQRLARELRRGSRHGRRFCRSTARDALATAGYCGCSVTGTMRCAYGVFAHITYGLLGSASGLIGYPMVLMLGPKIITFGPVFIQ